MLQPSLPVGLTFDDVALVPAKSSVLPAETDTRTRLTRRITINIPIVSAAMDTVTEARLAIAIAREGGIGIIHRVLSPVDQAAEVDKVKKSESGMILNPVTISPEHTIRDAHKIMEQYRISGIPVTKNGKLVGIVTNRDLRFETRMDLKISQVMTRENLITAPEGTTLDKAREILHQHRIEKLLVVNDRFELKGLITIKDIAKRIKFPDACKDAHGRLRVGAAVGVGADAEERLALLTQAGVDVVVVDTAHGHSVAVLERRFCTRDARIKCIVAWAPSVPWNGAGAIAMRKATGPCKNWFRKGSRAAFLTEGLCPGSSINWSAGCDQGWVIADAGRSPR